MRRLCCFALTFLLAASLSAAPAITSITPNTGRVAGEQIVIIKGSAFSSCIICSPPTLPAVSFGGTSARSVELVDSTTLRVTTPPLLQATYDVTVTQFDGSATLNDAFTVSGEPAEGFETILVPIYNRPVFGAFGSEFRTSVRAANKADVGQIPLYGADYGCLMLPPVARDPIEDPLMVDGRITYDLPVDCSNWPARLLYIPKIHAGLLTMNSRVHDVSRNARSHGTEIPIVRSAEIKNEDIVFLGVPIDARFRNTLRIYSTMPAGFFVSVNNGVRAVNVRLEPGKTIFEPSFAMFTDFPRPEDLPGGQQAVRVRVFAPPGPGGPFPGAPGPPIWAFITVTNNETQEITTITPD